MKIHVVALAAFAALPALAVQCGDTVYGQVVLSANLQCNASSGLTVGANGTVVNLNGHTISCVGAGFLGSCQGQVGQSITATSGIASNGFDHVTIQNGTISGFAVGVSLSHGIGAVVKDVKVTGPATPFWQNYRSVAKGIALDMMIPKSGANLHPAQIINNEVSNQVIGISLVNSNGNYLTGNNVHDNAGELGGSAGVSINMGHVNTITANSISHNGLNHTNDAGIYIVGEGNQVLSNLANYNCGDGIHVANGALDTIVAGNTARFSGAGSALYACPSIRGPRFDLSDLNAGTNNQFNANNVCHTQSPGIPAGVCKPTE